MKNQLLRVCVLALILIGCKKNENQKATVNLNFQTENSGTNYTFLEEFTNGDGIKIRIEVLQFYISNIRFVNKKGKEILAEDIALIKCDLNGLGTAEVKVPAGNYTSLRFGIGVPKELNEKTPADFTEVNHPLNSSQNTYWGMNSMYRFLMLDGKYDLEGDGLIDGSFSYHTGYEDSYRDVELVHDFSFDRKGVYSQAILIDVSKLFYVTGNIVDVVTESNFHGNYAEIDLSLRVSDNFANAVSIH